MTDLEDGEATTMQGSGKSPYVLRNTGGVYSCSCPAWRNQSLPIERRTCKHLRKLRGEAAERERIGSDLPAPRRPAGGDADAPPVLLAHRWENDVDLTGWWLSEKLDGVRAWWDGEKLLSRLGNVFLAPDSWRAPLPSTPLDGELWIGRGLFQRTVSVVRRADRAEEAWAEVRYLVFDAPAIEAPFEERQERLREMVEEAGAPHVDLVGQRRCEGLDDLRAELDRIEAAGGEGLMLRQPGSAYEAGRSTTLFKVKSFRDDEARVVGHTDGRGRHAGRVGALEVETPDGVRFKVGTGLSDAQRESPPPVGAVITYRYQELTNDGVPRFPSFVGVRIDAPGAMSAEVAAVPRESPTEARVSPGAPAALPRATPPTSAATPSSGAATSGSRRFELVDGKSSKFWEVAVDGSEVRVRFGRIGTTGQSKAKDHGDAAKATSAAEKLVQQKTGKGYVEV